MKKWLLVLGLIVVILVIGCELNQYISSENVTTDYPSNSNSNNDNQEGENEDGNSDSVDVDEPLGPEDKGYIKIILSALDSTTEPQVIEYILDKGLEDELSHVLGDNVVTKEEPLVLKFESSGNSINTYFIYASDLTSNSNGTFELSNYAFLMFPFTSLGIQEIEATGYDFANMDRTFRQFFFDFSHTDENNRRISVMAPNLSELETGDDKFTYSVDVKALKIGSNSIAGTFLLDDLPVRQSIDYDTSEIGRYSISVEFKLRILRNLMTSIVTYNGNGETSGVGPGYSLGHALGGYIADNGSNYTSSPFEHVGKVFTGWNSKKDSTGRRFLPGERYTELSDIQLYAQWEDPFEIVQTENGYIFYENPDPMDNSWKYLEILSDALETNYTVPWSNVQDSLVGTSADIGMGDQNSIAIINQQGHTESAAKKCLEYENGKEGWYLPSTGELFQAISHIAEHNPSFSIRAWSSTELSAKEVYSVDSEYYLFIHDKYSDEEYYAPIYPVRKLDNEKKPIIISIL